MSKFALSLVLVFFVFSALAEVQSPVTTAVNKTRVKTGEKFSFTVTISGSFADPKIELPEFAPFKVVSRNQSRQYQIRGGKAEMKSMIQYRLVCLEPGNFVLGRVRVKDKEKEYFSQEIKIEVYGEKIEKKEKTPDRFKGAVTL